MRNNTRTESARPYLPLVIRHNKILPESASFGTEYIRSANKELLKDMANSLVQDTPYEPLYLCEISPELPVQRTSYRDSRAGAALIVKYKQDLLRRPSLTSLPPSRVDDRTLGVVPSTTDVTTETTTTTGVTRVIHVQPKAWVRVNSKGKCIPTLRVIQKSLRAIKSEKVKQPQLQEMYHCQGSRILI